MTNQNRLDHGSDSASLTKLSSPPLRRAICAIYFAPVLRISDTTGAGIGIFQDLIRGSYPAVQLEHTHEIEIHADDSGLIGDPKVLKHPLWRFSSDDGRWGVLLTHQSLTLETQGDYGSREALVERFADIVEALSATFSNMSYRRLGFRFFNLFQGEKLSGIREYIRPELIGSANQFSEYNVASTWSALQLVAGSNQLRVQYGFAPTGMQSEMQATPLTEPAWVLDIDGSQIIDNNSELDLRGVASNVTDRICHFFSWSVTKRFIEDYRHDHDS